MSVLLLIPSIWITWNGRLCFLGSVWLQILSRVVLLVMEEWQTVLWTASASMVKSHPFCHPGTLPSALPGHRFWVKGWSDLCLMVNWIWIRKCPASALRHRDYPDCTATQKPCPPEGLGCALETAEKRPSRTAWSPEFAPGSYPASFYKLGLHLVLTWERFSTYPPAGRINGSLHSSTGSVFWARGGGLEGVHAC